MQPSGGVDAARDTGQTVSWPQATVPVTEGFDVLIAGAGMAGVVAAITSAQAGLNTGLIEYFGKPGGIPVSGGLGNINGFDSQFEHCVGGLAREIRDEMQAKGGLQRGLARCAWDAEMLSAVLLRRLRDAGVHLFFYTQLMDAIRQDRLATHALVASKAGVEALAAKLFIDDTGDADLAARLGCTCEKGRESDGLTQSGTLVIKIGGVSAAEAPRDLRIINRLWTSRPRQVPIDHTVVNYLPYAGSDTAAVVNMTHVLNFDGTRKEDLTRARLEGMAQAEEVLAFFKQEVPGFEHAYLDDTGMQIGVRETRRIVGDYVLTEDDVVGGRDFADAIARGCAPIDIHNPDKPHVNFGSPGAQHRSVPRSYGIPYRCLTPTALDNLLVVGRAISATHRAAASTRYNATCAALGEAAGCACALAIETQNVHTVDPARLRDALRARHAILDRSLIAGHG